MTLTPIHTSARRSARGFTLIEILVTFAIMAILLGLAAPSFITFQRNSDLTSTANSFVGALATARSEALKRQLNAFVIPRTGQDWSTGWIVYVDSNKSNTTSFDVAADLLVARADPIPSTVVASAGFTYAGSNYVEFNGAGFMTTTANGIATAGMIEFTSVTGEKRRVIANPAGRLRVCKPADAGCNATDI